MAVLLRTIAKSVFILALFVQLLYMGQMKRDTYQGLYPLPNWVFSPLKLVMQMKTDWVYVDNLVLALIMASMGLLDDIDMNEEHQVASGQAYFISDGSPINTFEFLQPPLRSLDYDLPAPSWDLNVF